VSIAHKHMKKGVKQSRKQDLDLDPANHIAAEVLDNSCAVGAEHGQELAQLVWKYFGEEITETLREAQEALASEQSGSKP